MNRFVALLFCGVLLISNMAFANSAVVLQPATKIDRVSIRLSDVFSGVPPTIDRDIAVAPLPGKSVTYNVNVLNRLAQQYRLDWQPQGYGDRAILTRAATVITQDMIRDAVTKRLLAQEIKGKIDFTFDNRALEVNLPTDRPSDFTLNNFTYDNISKRFRADLTAISDTGPIVLPVSGRVMVKREIPVLMQHMEAGTTISKADLDWLTVPEERITTDVITDASVLIGQELKRPTDSGQFLRNRDIMPPRMVTRGSLVMMKIETPAMLITTQGRAMQDGALGDVIRITNTQSNRVIEGTVEAPGIIRIQTGQKLASAG